MNYNYLANCISKSCARYDTCARALSKSNKPVDYLRIDEDECVWYTEVKLEVEEVIDGEEKTETREI